MILHVVATSLLAISAYYTVRSLLYVANPRRGRPDVLPLLFVSAGISSLLYRMLMSHSCRAQLESSPVDPIPQVKAYPVVDTSLLLLTAVGMVLVLASALAVFAGDIARSPALASGFKPFLKYPGAAHGPRGHVRPDQA